MNATPRRSTALPADPATAGPAPSAAETLRAMGVLARSAARHLMTMPSAVKDAALEAVAAAVRDNAGSILAANARDIEAATARGTPPAMLDRLLLNRKRVEAMAAAVFNVAALPDPVGDVLSMWKRPNGLVIGKKRVPLGVVGIIYEARPNVTLDAAALCLKTGNAVILRGGSEAIYSNTALVDVVNRTLARTGFPSGAVQIVTDTSRETANQLMKLNGYIDVLIPRGGAGLIRSVVENATVPVIETGVGNCHVYVEGTADLEMAERITFNAKVSRPSVCNAAESLLVDESIAADFLPRICRALINAGVQIRGCGQTLAILAAAGTGEPGRSLVPASEEDWSTEFLDLILAVKVTGGFDDAVRHINQYGSKHSEAVVTGRYDLAQRFLDEVDAAAVYVNASTRFTDGEEFGFGAEIGISTQKLHARGPMGLAELTTVKYIVYGSGQIR